MTNGLLWEKKFYINHIMSKFIFTSINFIKSISLKSFSPMPIQTHLVSLVELLLKWFLLLHFVGGQWFKGWACSGGSQCTSVRVVEWKVEARAREAVRFAFLWLDEPWWKDQSWLWCAWDSASSSSVSSFVSLVMCVSNTMSERMKCRCS